MRVYLQTRFTSPSAVYDTDAPAGSSTIGKFLMELVKPYAKVQEGNITLYEFSKPYADESAKYQFIAGLVAAGVIIGGASLLFALGRASK